MFFYDLKLSHNTSVTERRTDRETDRWTDGYQFVPIARPLLKYGRLKTNYANN